MRLYEACLEAPDVGALVRRVHPCGCGFAGGSQVGVPKGRPALQGPHRWASLCSPRQSWRASVSGPKRLGWLAGGGGGRLGLRAACGGGG